MCRVSVIIPTHHRNSSAIRLLESLKKQSLANSAFEVLLISNLEDPTLIKMVSSIEWPFSMRVLSVGEIGVNKARNLGLKKAQGEIAYFLDDDCELIHPDQLKIVLSSHLHSVEATAIGGGYQLPKNSEACERAYHQVAMSWYQQGQLRGTDQVTHLLGGNVSYKMEDLKNKNLTFNEHIIFGGAESELHQRILNAKLILKAELPLVRHHLNLNLQSFYKKAFMQGLGAQHTKTFRDWHKAPTDSTFKNYFWKFQYERVFLKGLHWDASKNPAESQYLESGMKLFFLQFLLSLFVPAFRFLLWRGYSVGCRLFGFGQVLFGFGKAVFIELYWISHRLGSLIKSGFRYVYWKVHDIQCRVRGGLKRGFIGVYWKVHDIQCRTRGGLKRGFISIYWIVHKIKTRLYWRAHGIWMSRIKLYVYLRWHLRKDIQQLLNGVIYGIDPSQIPSSLPLNPNPSFFRPVSKECQAQCKSCHHLQAKASQYNDQNSPEAKDLNQMGFQSITFPCNFLSLSVKEQSSFFEKYSDLKHEIVIHPDFFNQIDFKWESYLSELLARGAKPLLLAMPGIQFQKMYHWLSEKTDNFGILYSFQVSGDFGKLYKLLKPNDFSKVQLITTQPDSPRVADNRNRELVPQIGRLISTISKTERKFWPRVSSIHFPFNVEPESLASTWVNTSLDWESLPKSSKVKEAIKYSIIIPVRHQIEHAQKVLKNLSHQRYDQNEYEVIFVDDGNDQPLAEMLANIYSNLGKPSIQIQVVRFPRETFAGYDNAYRAGQARNVGLRYARGENILFFDSDILISPVLFSELDEILKDDMIVQFPRHMLNKEATENFENYENLKEGRDTYTQSDYWEQFKNAEEWEDLKNYWKYTCTYGLGLKRKTLDKIGPFRSEYIFYGFEDVDLGYRLYQLGGKFKLYKSAVFHLYPDENHSFHFDQEKRFQALSKSASLFFFRTLDLNFYFDLKGFLAKPWWIRVRKPYYYLEFKVRRLYQVMTQRLRPTA